MKFRHTNKWIKETLKNYRLRKKVETKEDKIYELEKQVENLEIKVAISEELSKTFNSKMSKLIEKVEDLRDEANFTNNYEKAETLGEVIDIIKEIREE